MVRLNVVNRISCFCFIIFILRGIGVALGTPGYALAVERDIMTVHTTLR